MQHGLAAIRRFRRMAVRTGIRPGSVVAAGVLFTVQKTAALLAGSHRDGRAWHLRLRRGKEAVIASVELFVTAGPERDTPSERPIVLGGQRDRTR
jgi:hypothetical protein